MHNKVEKKSKRKFIIILIILIILVVGLGIYYSFFKPVKTGKHIPIALNEENLPGYLESLNIVQDLPKEANIQINFGDNKYSIKKGNVQEGGEENSDVEVSVPEDYIGKIGQEGLCSALQEAVQDGEINFETSLSNSELLWKYKGLLKYKDCIDI